VGELRGTVPEEERSLRRENRSGRLYVFEAGTGRFFRQKRRMGRESNSGVRLVYVGVGKWVKLGL